MRVARTLILAAQAASPATYTFTVQQTYSDGSVVNWSGPESSDAPAPRIDVRSSIGTGGSGGASTLSIVALIVGLLGLLAAGLAVADRRGAGGGEAGGGRGRPLA